MNFKDGRYFSNGDKNLYFRQSGSGAPTVIIEPGWGGLSAEWTFIAGEIAKTTSCICYDRAGYGESPVGKNERTASQIAGELFTALQNSASEPPYIIIGHNGGGFYAQQFALMFPRFTAGLVLVDSATADDGEFDRIDAPYYKKNMSMSARMASIKQYADLEQEEFEQIAVPTIHKIYSDFPEEIKHFLIAYSSDKNFYKTIVSEFASFEESAKAFNSSKSNYPNIPIKVICRDWQVMLQLSQQIGVPEDEARAIEELWLKLSRDLLALSDNSEFIIAKDSSHSIHYTNPAVIVEKTLELVESSRSGDKIEFFF